MRIMTERAQKIWEAFCGELAQKPTDDMREALATAIREISEDLYGDVGSFHTPEEQERFSIADDLCELADELDKLEELK